MAEPEISSNIWLLENVRIASPCPKDWNDMQGDNTKRFCDECGHHVYNFSNLTRDEAETLLRETEGRLCARLYRREDGAVMTSDCPKPVEVPVPTGFFARWKDHLDKKRREKNRLWSGMPMEKIPHLTGIIARPEPWTANPNDTSSTRSSEETSNNLPDDGTENDSSKSKPQ